MTSAFRSWNGMCWPAPKERLREIERSLRYGDKDAVFSMEDRLIAAAVINGYYDLIFKPVRRRNSIINELRKGPYT